MSLREEIATRLPEYVESVKVTRRDYKGLDTINVVVNYRVSGKLWFLDMNFAEKNKMTAEHMAAVLNSYLHVDEGVAGWENEGGNGTHRS
jgi:hypothetical protein